MKVARKVGRVATVAGAAVFAIALTATSASAHFVTVSHGEDWGWLANNHRQVGVCDREADGNGVRVEYRTAAGAVDHIGDADGSGGGCWTEDAVGGSWVTSFRICEANNGCSAWKNS